MFFILFLFSISSEDGANTNVYVLDTGIRHSHKDFGGRAKYFWDFDPAVSV